MLKTFNMQDCKAIVKTPMVTRQAEKVRAKSKNELVENVPYREAVSYTHLTLPTIYSV